MEPENPVPDIVDDDAVVPNHRASAPLTGDKPRTERPGIFGRQSARTPRSIPKAPKDDVPNIPGQFVEGLTQAYAIAGAAVLPFKPALGMALTENSEACAKAWDSAAQKIPAVRRMLYGSGTAAAVFGLVIAHAPIAMAAIDNTPIGDRVEAYLKQRAEMMSGESAE